MRRLAHVLFFGLWVASAAFAQGSVLLVGGGTENYNDWSDIPYRWLVTHAPNRKIAVLHYSDTTAWFSGYFPSLSPCTVSNRAITSTAQANDSATYRFILQHDGIFLRGGDQAQYVAKWKGTLTQQAIKEVFQRGGVVGGSSAGEMVLSDVMFSAGTTDPWTLLRVPSSSITLVDDFLSLAPGILAESHTNERGRIGRLPVFLARYKSASGREVTGVAVDANSACGIGPDGVGEVMGGSAAMILRWSADTRYRIESGKPFSLSNMQCDQLLPGFSFNFQTGEVGRPGTALPFAPKQITVPSGAVILDGSGSSADWIAAGGSLRTLQSSMANPADSVGIISSPAAPASANTVNSALSSWGMASKVLWVDEGHKNDAALANGVASCRAFVFVGNALDSLGALLSGGTGIGTAFWSRIAAGAPTAFLSEDVMFAGEKAIGGLYVNAYSAYYGTLTQRTGLNLITGIQPMPRFYQNPDNTTAYDYSENRAMGMLWSMGLSRLPYGILIDAGAHVRITGSGIEARGISATSTPVMVVDARDAQWVDVPVFHRPGKPNAVQNAALVGARFRVVAQGDTAVLTDIVGERTDLPEQFRLLQNYPNPFNPATVVTYEVPRMGRESSVVSVKVYDLLGREVAVLANGVQSAGTHHVTWNASNASSGVYVVQLRFDDGTARSQSAKLLLVK